jgi:hypothetical protein
VTAGSENANPATLVAKPAIADGPQLGSAATMAILRFRGFSMRKSLLIFGTTALLACMSASAQKAATSSIRYKWHDGQGQLHFSDSLSAEAMKYGYDLVNDQGLVIQHVSRQLTAPEREAANKLAAQEVVKQRAAQQIANAETQMMAAYPDEDSYKISQQQELDTIDQQIHTTQINLRSQEKTLTDLLARAAEIERNKSPVPKGLANIIGKQRDVVAGQHNTLQRQQALRAQTVAAQVKQLARYRELKAAQAQSSN